VYQKNSGGKNAVEGKSEQSEKNDETEIRNYKKIIRNKIRN